MHQRLGWTLLLGVIAAEPALQRFEKSEPHMGTRVRIVQYAPDRATADRAARAALDRIAHLNTIMSDYSKTSEIMRLCAASADKPGSATVVSGELFAVLRQARAVSELSDGAFDVTVGPLSQLWRPVRRTQKLPAAADIAAARAHVDYRQVELDSERRTVRLLRAGVQLDLGGIAKGYAADEALRVLATHGVTRALVAAGGDLALGDPPPGERGWKVAIARLPGEPETELLLLCRCGVSTSGDAEQFVVIDGTRYSHLFDPRTGQSLTGMRSVTVIAPRGLDSDPLTKVASVLRPAEALKLLAMQPGVAVRIAFRSSEKAPLRVWMSKGFPSAKPQMGERGALAP